MLRQTASRNQRNKGFKIKNFLQISILVAISIWLLYQLKHSYDKKMAMKETGAKSFDRAAENRPDFFMLGRKGTPLTEARVSMNETHKKERENEEVEEEEDLENKKEAEEEEGKEDGVDEFMESNEMLYHEKNDDENDEEAELGVSDQSDEMPLVDVEEHGDSQRAREENYKRDDVSSAVGHGTQTTKSEFGDGDVKNLDEEHIGSMEEKDVEVGEAATNETNGGSNRNIDMIAGAVNVSNGNASSHVLGENKNISTVERKDSEAVSSTLEAQSISNSTAVESDSKKELPNNSTASTESNNHIELPILNSTAVEPDSKTVLQNNSTASTESNNRFELQTNSIIVVTNQTAVRNNSTDIDAAATNVPQQNVTVGLDSAQDRNATVNPGTAGEDKPYLTDAETEQAQKINTSKIGDAAQGESNSMSDNAMTADEREGHTDLPIIENEVKNNDDEAIE